MAKDPPMNKFYLTHLLTHGGLINTGDCLGIMISSSQYIANCPPGWIFVDRMSTSLEELADIIVYSKHGRKNWPNK